LENVFFMVATHGNCLCLEEIWKSGNMRVQKNLNIEKIFFKVVHVRDYTAYTHKNTCLI